MSLCYNGLFWKSLLSKQCTFVITSFQSFEHNISHWQFEPVWGIVTTKMIKQESNQQINQLEK